MIMQINYSKQAVKFLSKQNKIVQKRIIDAINILPSGDVRKLQGRTGYRLRVGNFRIIFSASGNILYVEEVNNRRQIYK